MKQQVQLEFGEWIAVAWGGQTGKPSGCSYHVSLVCGVDEVFDVRQVEQSREIIRQKILELYDHREITGLDFVPESFLRQVIEDFVPVTKTQSLTLCTVKLQDHDQWSMVMHVPDGYIR